jgi:hypothetical protein
LWVKHELKTYLQGWQSAPAEAGAVVVVAQGQAGNIFIKLCKLILTNIAKSLYFHP